MLFKTCYLQLCVFSNQFTKNMNDAREVVQELFVYLWENKEKTKKIDSVQSYVYAALRFNSIRKFNAKTRNRIEIAEVPEEAWSVDFQDQVEYAELLQAVYKTIDLLPPQCRKIFMMSRFEKLTYQEIANILGISPKTVEVQISKALRNLHETFKKYHSGIIFLCMFNHLIQ
jgi:RNA polymerase sigma-70 factor (ECF subfamily)